MQDKHLLNRHLSEVKEDDLEGSREFKNKTKGHNSSSLSRNENNYANDEVISIRSQSMKNKNMMFYNPYTTYTLEGKKKSTSRSKIIYMNKKKASNKSRK